MHLSELKLIEWFQEIRTPLLDQFFYFLNFFDTDWFYILLLPIVWFMFSWKWGMRLFFIVLASAIVNAFFKDFFAQPRPYQMLPSVGLIEVKGYGFPSGAAQSAVIFAGLIIRSWKSKWAWVIGVNYFFWISLSRIYLGVHFPTDVLGGWFLGGIIFALYHFYDEKIETWFEKRSFWQLLLLSHSFFLLLYLIHPKTMFLRIAFSAMGLCMGLLLAYKFKFLPYEPKQFVEKLSRFFVGFFVLFLLSLFWRLLIPDAKSIFILPIRMIASYIMGLWISLGMEFLFQKLIYKKTFKSL